MFLQININPEIGALPKYENSKLSAITEKVIPYVRYIDIRHPASAFSLTWLIFLSFYLSLMTLLQA